MESYPWIEFLEELLSQRPSQNCHFDFAKCPPIEAMPILPPRAGEGCFPEHSAVRYPIFIVSKLITRKWSLGEVFLFHLSELKHCLIGLRAVCLLFCDLSWSVPISLLFLVSD